jgi:hypothetical protein
VQSGILHIVVVLAHFIVKVKVIENRNLHSIVVLLCGRVIHIEIVERGGNRKI